MTLETLLTCSDNFKKHTLIKCNNQEEWTKCYNIIGRHVGNIYHNYYPYMSLDIEKGKYSEDYIQNKHYNIYDASELFTVKDYHIKTTLL